MLLSIAPGDGLRYTQKLLLCALNDEAQCPESEDPRSDVAADLRDFLEQDTTMPKRTFQPNRRRRAKVHGFLSRMATKAGAAVLSRRRAKGRHKIAVSAGFRD